MAATGCSQFSIDFLPCCFALFFFSHDIEKEEMCMKEVFVICNHDGLFLGKQGQWLDESEPALVYRTPHRDIALNHLIEVNARDIEQRLVMMQCPLNEKDVPLLGDVAVAKKSVPVTFDDEPAVSVVDDADSDEAVSDDVDNVAVAANDSDAIADISYPA
jgi:hypothetical protein